jgi:hypothetical protein
VALKARPDEAGRSYPFILCFRLALDFKSTLL